MGDVGTAFGGVPTPDTLAQFLGRVLPWGAPGEPETFVNVHGFTPKWVKPGDRQFPRKGGGRAYATLVEYPQLQQFLFMLDQAGDEAFYCISTRSAFKGTDARGNRKATRAKAVSKAVRLKAFVLDLDVKPRGYRSQREALAAVLPFFDGLGIKPTIVDTGSGLHAYPTLTVGITPTEWQPLANALIEAAKQAGLKFDVAVTRDDDRILRLPGSRNLKDPANPRMCRLLQLGADVTVEHLRTVLAPFMGVTSVSPRVNGGAPQVDLSFLPPRPPITGPEAERARAEVARNRVVTTIDGLLGACPLVADSDWRGGDGDPEPLWKELANLCHYVDNGRDFFHDLSSEDPRYEEAATDQKFDERVLLGWPLCSTLAATCEAAERICKTCPHYGEGKSPLHFATRGDPPGEVNGGQVNGHVNGHLSATPFITAGVPVAPIWVPRDYRLDQKNLLWTPEGELACDAPIYNFGVAYEDSRQLLEFEIDLGTVDGARGHFFIDGTATATRAKFTEAAATHGMRVNKPIINSERRMELDLLSRMRELRAANVYKRCGWTEDGFVYGGKVYTEDSVRLTSTRDPDIGPHGTLEAWKAVVDNYVGHGLVDMEIFIASAFAAPLLKFTSVDGGIIFARSSQSGYGKSASLFIGASVWYRRNVVVEKGTTNFVLDRLAQLNNLPIYFDELVPASPSAKAFADLIKAVSSGIEPGRLSRSSKQMQQRHSCTILGANANASLIEIAKVPDSNAQAARVLEYEMSDAFTRRPKDFGDTSLHRVAMNENCGTAGAVYAEFLGRHRVAIQSLVVDELRHWQQQMKSGDAERFWCCNAAALMVGATIAKKLNLLNFDIAGMRRWLRNWFVQQRTEVIDMATNADDPNVQLQRIADFLNENARSRVITNKMPAKGSAKCDVLNPLQVVNTNTFVARIAKEEQRMWISERALEAWCKHVSRGYSYTTMKKALLKSNYCTRHRGGRMITAGTDYISAKEIVLEFNLQDPRLQLFHVTEDT